MCRSSPCLQFPRKMKKNGSSMMAADLWINRAMAARQREVGSGWMSELTSRRLMLMPVVDVAAAAAAARRVDAIGRDGGARLLLGVMGEVSWGRGGWLRRLLGPVVFYQLTGGGDVVLSGQSMHKAWAQGRSRQNMATGTRWLACTAVVSSRSNRNAVSTRDFYRGNRPRSARCRDDVW